MLSSAFELYGSRFRWYETGPPPSASKNEIALVRASEPLGQRAVDWITCDDAHRLKYGRWNGRFVYRFENIAEFRFPIDGNSVEAYFEPAADPGAIDFVLCRGILPRLLHLRGAACLHASAVNMSGKAVVFCGPSGSGKSTIAAGLALRGHPLMSDDVIPMRASEDGQSLIAGPGLPELRLHPSTVAQLGLVAEVTPPGAGQTKAIWRPSQVETSPLPLAAIYLLEPRKEGLPRFACLLPSLSPQEALKSLLFNSYWLDPGQTDALASDLSLFARIVRIAAISPLCFELSSEGFAAVETLVSEATGAS